MVCEEEGSKKMCGHAICGLDLQIKKAQTKQYDSFIL